MKEIQKLRVEIGRHVVAIQDTRETTVCDSLVYAEQQEIAKCLGLALWQLEAALEMIQALLKKKED